MTHNSLTEELGFDFLPTVTVSGASVSIIVMVMLNKLFVTPPPPISLESGVLRKAYKCVVITFTNTVTDTQHMSSVARCTHTCTQMHVTS